MPALGHFVSSGERAEAKRDPLALAKRDRTGRVKMQIRAPHEEKGVPSGVVARGSAPILRKVNLRRSAADAGVGISLADPAPSLLNGG
ncbi:hypothetical protein [Methylobacterium oxalidis]|uniref:hypothetical protein n=1 Tax=Methylobacterium oxalidis TaxID=944322 RepID=UPI003315A5F5